MKNSKIGRMCWITGILFVWMFCLSTAAYATEKIDSIDIDVLLNDDGSADITQVWDIETNKGTEFYITMSRMGDMQVQDLRVTDETGREFTFVGKDWDVEGSLEDKAYLCGFHPISDGFEMCWGKGSYGRHTYTLQYRLTDLVKSYPDYDGFNTRFVNDQISPDVQSATVTIRFADASKNTRLHEEEVGIWAFGYEGTILFENGKVVAKTDRPIGSSNYLNVMMRFSKELIRPISQGQGTFEELKETAFKGSDYKKKTGLRNGIIGGLVAATVLYIILDGKSKAFLKRPFRRMGGKSQGAGYSRELPMKSNLATTVWTMEKTGEKVHFEDIFHAYLMKLIKDRALQIVPCTDPDSGAESFEIRFNAGVPIEDENARNLFGLLTDGMGAYNKITERELREHLERSSAIQGRAIGSWMSEVQMNGHSNFLIEHDGYEGDDHKLWTRMRIKLRPGGFEDLQQMFDFRKFLKDFTLIEEREVKEVELWDDYLVFATLFGMADRVAKQMRKIDPSFEQRSALLSQNYGRVDRAVRSMSKMYHSAKDASEGKGGRSSSGGGDGYSGGGSGGGSR
ncbi:MAG: DUF2207 domain-containing protein [Peptostreptococcaceae bacterium]|nr:DUF2207 domain-containing protein [Peptostreptococcaceae bacterium]